MFDSLVKKILKRERVKGRINIVLIDDKEIRKLNKQFRKKDKATDVLAFPMGEDGILGDIAISAGTTKRNAKSYGVSYKSELKRLVVHGVLHLLGYGHGKRMSDAEKIYQGL
ncbi:MAG: rRNA maturation RNase YbeY [Candidatus Margulisiibacteriota bacterium]|nr:rRNA maturation RNase YbeY [Candidatus Margulisiibacteriota bacterium]